MSEPSFQAGASLTERSHERGGYVRRAATLPVETIQRCGSTVAKRATLVSSPPQLPCIGTQSPQAPSGRSLPVFTLSVERLGNLGTTPAGHPHAPRLDAAIHLPAAPMLLKEGIEGVPERLHGFGSVTEPASMVDDHNRIHNRTRVKLLGLMSALSNAPGGEHMNACKLCGETRTFSRTYTVTEGPTYMLRYFICKHPMADVSKAQPSSSVQPTRRLPAPSDSSHPAGR
jgi:hypothetical protein